MLVLLKMMRVCQYSGGWHHWSLVVSLPLMPSRSSPIRRRRASSSLRPISAVCRSVMGMLRGLKTGSPRNRRQARRFLGRGNGAPGCVYMHKTTSTRGRFQADPWVATKLTARSVPTGASAGGLVDAGRWLTRSATMSTQTGEQNFRVSSDGTLRKSRLLSTSPPCLPCTPPPIAPRCVSAVATPDAVSALPLLRELPAPESLEKSPGPGTMRRL